MHVLSYKSNYSSYGDLFMSRIASVQEWYNFTLTCIERVSDSVRYISEVNVDCGSFGEMGEGFEFLPRGDSSYDMAPGVTFGHRHSPRRRIEHSRHLSGLRLLHFFSRCRERHQFGPVHGVSRALFHRACYLTKSYVPYRRLSAKMK